MRLSARCAPLLVALATAPAPARAQAPAQVPPIARAYAHNDYVHTRPLLDALDQGFDAVEADVHLLGGRLLVAHDSTALADAPTLERLYLDPLLERVRRTGGQVQDGMPPFLLMVDVKSEAEPTWVALERLLARYAEMLTRFTADSVAPGPVLVLVSGQRARAAMTRAASRLTAFDGRLDDLDGPVASPAFMPLVSDEWKKVSGWKGRGNFPERDRRALLRLVERVHGQGRKLRLYGAPDVAAVWQVLLDAGVDYINTDDLPGLRSFLERRD